MKVNIYIGKVFDRLTGRLVYESRVQMDYKTAHELAEKHAKGNRYVVVVDDVTN